MLASLCALAAAGASLSFFAGVDESATYVYHETQIDKLTGLRAQAVDNGRQTMEALIDYLNEWLYQHILKSDRELAALLNRKQAARPLP